MGPTRLLRSSHLLPLVLGLSACQAGWTEHDQAGLTHLRKVVTPEVDGLVDLDLPVPDGHDGLILTLRTADGDTAFFHRLRRPTGGAVLDASQWWDRPQQRQDSMYSSVDPTLVWPSAPGDEPLESGLWSVQAYVEGGAGPVIAELSFRQTRPATERSLHLTVWHDLDAETDADTLQAVETALSWWRDDLFAPLGLGLVHELRSVPLPSPLPDPTSGHVLYENLADQVPLDSLSLVLGDRIEGFEPGTVRGRSGGLPGPIAPSPRRAVALCLQEAAGDDGILDPTETLQLGQTMAHEVGHYLGLMHPVERPCGDGDLPDCSTNDPVIETWDALADTEDCATWLDCVQVLGDNLMFPHTLCEADDEVSDCRAQHRLTEDQLTVLMRHAAFH